jgi:PAS domain S-box-containing protein
MLTANHNKQTLHVNQRFCDMVGYSKAELQTIDWGKLTHLDDIALNQQYMDSAIRGEIDSYQLEKRYIHKDGHSVYVHLSTSCVRDAQGQVDYFIGMMLDISERKRSEQRLQQSESRFRELFAHTPVAYQSLDRNGCFLDVNEPLCRLLGYTREALIGRAVSEFWSTRLRPDFKKRFARFIEKGQSHGELELLKANGELITVLLEGRVQYDMQGNFVCTHCILVNITERKRMEDALNQSNADLEQFAYGVSHDMRQPLRAITNHLQLLQRSIASELDSDNAENLSFALEGAQRMDAMIKSLLEYSRIGRLAEHKTWLLSRDALNEAIDFLSNALEDAHIHLSITGEWSCIFASHDELVRLFLNLLSNAIKYRETAQPPLVTINAVIIGTQWQVSVRDFGIGIEPEQIGRLFQFFGRLHPWQRFEGTGMGLALCKRIVEHHQGTIWVESIGANQGCCFYFSLPLTVELAK